jgi:hypothetical protein
VTVVDAGGSRPGLSCVLGSFDTRMVLCEASLATSLCLDSVLVRVLGVLSTDALNVRAHEERQWTWEPPESRAQEW